MELELTLPDAKLGRIEVIQPSGARVPGAELHLRLDTWPYYALGATTDQSGAWTGLLAAGRWDVEVIPPRNEETREKEFARIQASLDLRETDASTVVALRRADRIDGFAYSVGQLGVGNVQLLLSDPESGNLLDETVSNNSDFPGFFTAVLPR